MTNAVRGRVSLELGGQTYQLEFTIDALIQLEERLGQPAIETLGRIGKDRTLGFARTLLWAGLREHHGKLTEKQAGELIRLPGGDKASDKVLEAFISAWPEAEEGANPQKGQTQSEATATAGTGDASLSSGTSEGAASPTPTGDKLPEPSSAS